MKIHQEEPGVRNRAKRFALHDLSTEILIGHIFLKGEAKFTAEDMEVAGLLLKSVDLPQNVQDFLEVVVGSREGVDMYQECVAALTFPQK